MPPLGEATVDDAQYQDNSIFINEIEFIVHGPIVAGTISEFTTGLKIGAATYDERENAFWAVLDDFSGGFGHRVLDIRAAGGTHFDNVGGIDLRHPRHISLPGLRTVTTPTSSLNPDAIGSANGPFAPTMLFSNLGSDQIHMAIGNALYTLNVAGTLTRRETIAGGGDRIVAIVDFRGSDGTRRLYANSEDDANYFFSTNGTTWANGSGLSGQSGMLLLWHAIVWDAQIIAFGKTGAGATGITSSADGVNWSNDDSNIGFHWIPRDNSGIFFVGVAMAPWGASAPYFIDTGDLYVLDWYVYNAVRIEGLGEDNRLLRGTIWNGQIVVTDGRRVWLYEPASANIRPIGPFGVEGAAPSWIDNDYRIAQLIGGANDLFALCVSESVAVPSNDYRIAVYNGVGWSWFGPEVTGQIPWGALVGTIVSTTDTTAFFPRSLHVMQHPLASVTTTLSSWQLPEIGDVAYVGSGQNQSFEDGPLTFETGWFDGGFSDLEGVLLKMDIDGYQINADETVRVEYRLNNNESSGYTDLGTFTDTQQTLFFTDDGKGIPFKTVQFRVSLDRGSTAQATPILKALILLFDKKPLMRTSWTVKIDASRMIERNRTLENEELATFEAIWQQLKTFYNTPQLLTLRVPSVESGGVLVRITDMPATIEDFRESFGGRGTIQIDMIETVARR